MTDCELRIECAEAMGWVYPGSTFLKDDAWDRWIPPKGSNSRRVPDYPADLNAAFTLVEKLRKSGWWMSFEYFGKAWRARFYTDASTRRITKAASDASLARAICLTFLRAYTESPNVETKEGI